MTARPKPDPKFSAGARLERKAFTAYLRRYANKPQTAADGTVAAQILSWVLRREARYSKRPGGLGRG